MMNKDDELVQQAKQKLKENDKAAARSLLRQALRINSKNEQALFELANATDDPPKRLSYLKRAMKIKEKKAVEEEEIRKIEASSRKTLIIWNKTTRLRAALIFLIFTLIPFSWWIYADVIPALRTVKQMTGEWNVAVAGFSSLDTDLRRGDVVLISSVFSNRFSQEMESLGSDANLIVQVWAPQQVNRSITGNTTEKRAIEAEKIAREINADMLIYGTIQQVDGAYVLQPEFYIRAENYYEADELIGQHRFGGPITIFATRDTLPSQVPLNIELARRSGILALVARGLSLYLVHSYDHALQLFTQANQSDLWSNPDGQEVVYLLQGNAAIRNQQFELARLAYEQTIQIEPGYGRGYLGLGNIAYMQALDASNQVVSRSDQGGLDQAITYFEQALQAAIQPPSANIPSKAAFGLGQVYMVKWFAGQDTRALAVEQFNLVLTNYGNGENHHLQELASEAHGRLGVIYRQEGDVNQALAEFQQAIELSNLPARRGLYWASISDLYTQQRNIDQAQIASQRSIEQYQLALSLQISDSLRSFYWARIAERYESLQDTAQALVAYQQALNLSPTGSADFIFYQQKIDALTP